MHDDVAKVLLVEDDDVDALLMERLLSKHALSVDMLRACDGQEALQVLRETSTPPRVILLDLNMPVMNGFEFLEELRADASIAHCDVIILSTSSQDRDIERAREFGVDDYFVKDITPNMSAFVVKLRDCLGLAG